MDSFVLAVLIGAGSVTLIFGLLIVLDKGKPAASSTNAPAKVAGKR